MTYRVITASLSGGVITLVLNDVGGLEVGVCIRVYRTGQARIDRRLNIATINEETNTITAAGVGPNITAFNPPAASLVPLVTWVADSDVALFLGFTPEVDSDDELFLSKCVDAANEFGYRRRQQAGYSDSRCLIPNSSALQGVILYAAALYRERGSIDSFQSFGEQVIPGMTGSMGQILRLLGIGRPAVG
jgi:hypothetical protein